MKRKLLHEPGVLMVLPPLVINSLVSNIYVYIYIYIAAINALYFVHRAPYGGEDSTLYVYIYIYI